MNRQEANSLYDSFSPEAQDIPREQFIRRAVAATDPKRMRQDLGRIMKGKRERSRIDKAIGG